jgi:hypothetical protein
VDVSDTHTKAAVVMDVGRRKMLAVVVMDVRKKKDGGQV